MTPSIENTPSVAIRTRARVLRLLELLLEVRHVAVAVAVALRLAEADPVDDAGVVQGVADDRVLRPEQRLEEAAVGVEAGGVEDRGLHAEEARDGLLEAGVHRLRAADEAHGGHAVAPLLEGPAGGRHHLRMRRQVEVVVGAHVEHAAPVGELHPRALRPGDRVLDLEQALVARVLQLAQQSVSDGVGDHDVSSRLAAVAGSRRRARPATPG